MHDYVVEVYLPRSRALNARVTARRARAAAEELARDGLPIRYLRSTFLPDDETCFHFFAAGSPEIVEQAIARAALGRARVVPAVDASRGR